ncbi:MAG: Ldh family oxidoreductase [Lautropia sp.]
MTVPNRSIPPARLRGFIRDLARAAGMPEHRAGRFAEIFVHATLRGGGHHDVHDLPKRINGFLDRRINPDPAIRRVGGAAAIEAFDGDNGAGELCADHIVRRAGELARQHGIGCCTIGNSHHFLSAAPYVDAAAAEGLLAIVMSNSRPVMGMPGHAERLITNAPVGYATPSLPGQPLSLDICLAYASIGTLRSLAAAGQAVPAHWGTDATGAPSTDPGTIAEHGASLAIGGHKGFGLGLLVEVLTSVLARGAVAAPSPDAAPAGPLSQVAIVIDPAALMPLPAYRDAVGGLLERLTGQLPALRIPGRQAAAQREAVLRADAIALAPALIAELDELASRLDVAPL